jgi:uncharacterized protein with NRDE domain
MCLLILAWKVHPPYRLILAANRDEYHERPSAPLGQWNDRPEIVAGRDLRAGGTWLGVDHRGRLGVITNYRDLQKPKPGARSRGELIPAYLSGSERPSRFAASLEAAAAEYSGFNLLLTDADSMWYAGNRAEPFARQLPPGVYGLSNELLDSPWPKLVRVRHRFEDLLRTGRLSQAALLEILADRERTAFDEDQTPRALAPDVVQALSAPFVLHPMYGTRCSTVVFIHESGALQMIERRFDRAGITCGDSTIALAAHNSVES